MQHTQWSWYHKRKEGRGVSLYWNIFPLKKPQCLRKFYTFATSATALHYTQILTCENCFSPFRNGRLLGVCASVDNCRLFVGGIPKTKKREEILSEMKKVTEGVVDVIVYPSAADKTKNRGFAFVEYESHRAAAMARRRLLPGKPGSWTGTPNPQQTSHELPCRLSALHLVYFSSVTFLQMCSGKSYICSRGERTLINSNPTEDPRRRHFLRLNKPITYIAACRLVHRLVRIGQYYLSQHRHSPAQG